MELLVKIKEIKNWNTYAFKFIIISPIFYIASTLIAMIFYSGGTIYDPSTIGYFFWGNYFSDLGRINSLSGAPNAISFIIFNIGALTMSISLIPFLLKYKKLLSYNSTNNKFINLATISGFLFCLFMFMVVLTPWDVFGNIHLLFALLFNLSGISVAFFYGIAIRKNYIYPNIYSILYFLMIFLAFIYVLLSFITPMFPIKERIIIQASFQKFSQYSLMICFIIQGYGALRFQRYYF